MRTCSYAIFVPDQGRKMPWIFVANSWELIFVLVYTVRLNFSVYLGFFVRIPKCNPLATVFLLVGDNVFKWIANRYLRGCHRARLSALVLDYAQEWEWWLGVGGAIGRTSNYSFWLSYLLYGYMYEIGQVFTRHGQDQSLRATYGQNYAFGWWLKSVNNKLLRMGNNSRCPNRLNSTKFAKPS